MTIDDVVGRLNALGPAWLWFATNMRHGDIFHAAALADAFRDTHGSDLPIRVVVSTPAAAAVCGIYEDRFESIHIEPTLAPTIAEWLDYFAQHDFKMLAPDTPIVIHPHLNPETAFLNSFTSGNRVVWGQLYKNAFKLPPDLEPSAPPVRLESIERARRLLAASGMPRGRTMIVFPYAQSFPVSGAAHFSALAQQAAAQGWSVFTSVAPGEEAIAHTSPVFIPFDILLEVAEEAGWVVAVRSGICDITASARCRKTFIFRFRADLHAWGVDKLELARDAHQLVFPFEVGEPDLFCRRVLEGESDALSLPPRVLSDMVTSGMGGYALTTIDFVDIQRGTRNHPLARTRFGRRPDSVRLVNLGSRIHPRLASLADKAIADLVDRAGPRAHFYACRDCTLGLDFLEEIDARSLKAGRYAAARYWHTVVVDEAGWLKQAPKSVRERVLARSPLALGHLHSVGEAMYSGAQHAVVNGDRALDLQGVQFLSGWHLAEGWGVWSSGERSVLKFSLAEPATTPVVLELECVLLVTQVDGALTLRVRVNGREVFAKTVGVKETTRLSISIPPELLSDCTAYVEFDHLGARSPARLGDSDDPRRMALGLMTINVRE